jgi:hypothetical protein
VLERRMQEVEQRLRFAEEELRRGHLESRSSAKPRF